MDEKKELEKLMDKFFEHDQLDTPSSNFTASVIEKIEADRKSKLSYSPLLPKWVFVSIAVCFALFVAYVLSISDSLGPQLDYFESLDFSTSWISENVSQFSFSKTLGYSILAVGLLLCLQAGLLNKTMNRTNSLA